MPTYRRASIRAAIDTATCPSGAEFSKTEAKQDTSHFQLSATLVLSVR